MGFFGDKWAAQNDTAGECFLEAAPLYHVYIAGKMRWDRTVCSNDSVLLRYKSQRPLAEENSPISIGTRCARIANEIDENRRGRHHGPHHFPFALDNDSLGALAAVSERAINAPIWEAVSEEVELFYVGLCDGPSCEF